MDDSRDDQRLSSKSRGRGRGRGRGGREGERRTRLGTLSSVKTQGTNKYDKEGKKPVGEK